MSDRRIQRWLRRVLARGVMDREYLQALLLTVRSHTRLLQVNLGKILLLHPIIRVVTLLVCVLNIDKCITSEWHWQVSSQVTHYSPIPTKSSTSVFSPGSPAPEVACVHTPPILTSKTSMNQNESDRLPSNSRTRPNWNWVDERHMYMSKEGARRNDKVCSW